MISPVLNHEVFECWLFCCVLRCHTKSYEMWKLRTWVMVSYVCWCFTFWQLQCSYSVNVGYNIRSEYLFEFYVLSVLEFYFISFFKGISLIIQSAVNWVLCYSRVPEEELTYVLTKQKPTVVCGSRPITAVSVHQCIVLYKELWTPGVENTAATGHGSVLKVAFQLNFLLRYEEGSWMKSALKACNK
jgi:hypothetical protein